MNRDRHRSQPRVREPSLSDGELVQIISGTALDASQLMVVKAQEYGMFLSRDLKSSQIRTIFGQVRLIEMNWPRDESAPERSHEAARDLVLLKPRMAYQAGRHPSVKPLAGLLTRCIDLVGDNRDNFQHFVDFFEAILAYHKAEGGGDK